MAGEGRRRFLALLGARAAAFRFLVPAVALALLFPVAAGAYREFRDNTVHDFVRLGFKGGGVCDECHAAGGVAVNSRIFRFTFGSTSSDTEMCADYCHERAWPTGGNDPNGYWTGTGSVADHYKTTCLSLHPDGSCDYPPPMSHGDVYPPYRCGFCHRDQPLTGSAYADCLSCHTPEVGGEPFNSTGAGYDIGTDIEVDKFMDNIGSDADSYTTLSQHDIAYNAAGDLSTAADNECLKCHGLTAATDHPGGTDDTPFLVHPNTTTGIAKSNDYSQYQDFCLDCHRGDAGILLNDVPVPPVPPYEYRGYGNFNCTSTLPYFALTGVGDYYETNGHGRSTNFNSTAMNLTCLAQNPNDPGPQKGCHTAHGSNNEYLIEDSGGLGTEVDTPPEMGAVCMGCHTLAGSRFHMEWAGQLTHVESSGGYVVTWAELPPPNSMGTGVADMGSLPRILPFFSFVNADLHTDRQYASPEFGTSLLTCVTCHDPHGTSESYTPYNPACYSVNDTDCDDHTQGMLRVFVRTWGYDDPLCMNCHLSP